MICPDCTLISEQDTIFILTVKIHRIDEYKGGGLYSFHPPTPVVSPGILLPEYTPHEIEHDPDSDKLPVRNQVAYGMIVSRAPE